MAVPVLESVKSTQPLPVEGSSAAPATPGREPTEQAGPVFLAEALPRAAAARTLRRALRLAVLRSAAVRAALEPAALTPVWVPAWRVDVDVHSAWSSGEALRGTRIVQSRRLWVPGVHGAAGEALSRAAGHADGAAHAEAGDEPSGRLRLDATREPEEAWSVARARLTEAAIDEAALGLSLDETERLRVETCFENVRVRPFFVPAWRATGAGFLLDLAAFEGARPAGSAPWDRGRLAAVGAAVVVGLAALLLLLV